MSDPVPRLRRLLTLIPLIRRSAGITVDVRELLTRGHYRGSCSISRLRRGEMLKLVVSLVATESLLAHLVASGCSVRITSTTSPFSKRDGPTGRSMRQFASDIERRIPEPCGPVSRTVPSSGS